MLEPQNFGTWGDLSDGLIQTLHFIEKEMETQGGKRLIEKVAVAETAQGSLLVGGHFPRVPWANT